MEGLKVIASNEGTRQALKTFKLTERQSLRFRTDFFNLFNHPSFANPSATDVESPSSFTQITSVVGTPRLIQFSLKYAF